MGGGGGVSEDFSASGTRNAGFTTAPTVARAIALA